MIGGGLLGLAGTAVVFPLQLFAVGVAQGLQPIQGYNYGARLLAATAIRMNAESLLAAGAILMAVVLIIRGTARPAVENKTHDPPGSSGEGQYGLPGDSSDIFRNNARIIHASG